VEENILSSDLMLIHEIKIISITNRSYKILTVVYNTHNYWGSGLCPSSGILKTIKHNVSETGSVFVLR
jgi:hypothetical protein